MRSLLSQLRLVSAHTRDFQFYRNANVIRIIPTHDSKRTAIEKGCGYCEFAACGILRPDKYALEWHMSSANTHGGDVHRLQIMVYMSNYHEPDVWYDVRSQMRRRVVFEVAQAKRIFVLIRIETTTIVSIHGLYIAPARECLVGVDHTMSAWDMERVGPAFEMQDQIQRMLMRISAMWSWDEVQTNVYELMRCWEHALDTSLEAQLRGHAERVRSVFAYPTLIATSATTCLIRLCPPRTSERNSTWTLELTRNGESIHAIRPTFVHAQYFIWCLSDRRFKLALRRDAMPPVNGAAVEVAISAISSRMATPPMTSASSDSTAATNADITADALGYNMVANTPFYNFWSCVGSDIQLVNANDILVCMKQIDAHLEGVELN